MPGVGLTWDMGETRVRSQKSWVTGFQVGIGSVCRWGGVGSDTLDSGTISGGGAVSFMGVPGGIAIGSATVSLHFSAKYRRILDKIDISVGSGVGIRRLFLPRCAFARPSRLGWALSERVIFKNTPMQTAHPNPGGRTKPLPGLSLVFLYPVFTLSFSRMASGFRLVRAPLPRQPE